jgi:hypothetical protein
VPPSILPILNYNCTSLFWLDQSKKLNCYSACAIILFLLNLSPFNVPFNIESPVPVTVSVEALIFPLISSPVFKLKRIPFYESPHFVWSCNVKIVQLPSFSIIFHTSLSASLGNPKILLSIVSGKLLGRSSSGPYIPIPSTAKGLSLSTS